MSGAFFAPLLSGSFTFPESRINQVPKRLPKSPLLRTTFAYCIRTLMQCLCEQGGPLPDISGAPSQFHAITHAHINDRSRLLSGDSTGGLAPYAWAKDPALIATQTQMNIPNKKQVVISKLFLPSAQADAATAQVL